MDMKIDKLYAIVQPAQVTAIFIYMGKNHSKN